MMMGSHLLPAGAPGFIHRSQPFTNNLELSAPVDSLQKSLHATHQSLPAPFSQAPQNTKVNCRFASHCTARLSHANAVPQPCTEPRVSTNQRSSSGIPTLQLDPMTQRPFVIQILGTHTIPKSGLESQKNPKSILEGLTGLNYDKEQKKEKKRGRACRVVGLGFKKAPGACELVLSHITRFGGG